ncbi:MAG: hypothetical protein IPK87_08690 [Planctomycetes bacterium]|nr:hypothetical protein [Planctomycetota bacterium]
MKTGLWCVLALLALGLAAFVPADAQRRDKPNWKEKFPDYEKLGEKIVDFGADKDTIDVGARDGRFVSIMIGVDAGNLEMWDIKVTFGNDESYSPEVRANFSDDERSRQIDLPGEARVIKNVTFKYKSKRKEGKATVMLFGKAAKGDGPDKPDKPEAGKGPDSKDGLHFLGERKVDYGADKDTIDVGATEGRFVAIVIGVTDGDLEMWNVVIEFANGEKESPDTRLNFDEKERSRQIDLPGNKRVIKKVTFMYKSKITREGKAHVKLWGKPAGAEDRYEGWKHLGTRVVDFAKDTDVIIVGESKGKFTAFMVEVEDGDLEMSDITVTFGNSKQHSVETRLNFDENSRTRKIDLPGEARTLERLAFKYKSVKGGRDGKATVNVYGKEAK